MAKGYGIIMVLIGHLEFHNIAKFIYTFHIPLFFFLSGYVYKDTSNTTEFISKKIRKLLLPYLYLSIPMVGYVFIMNQDFRLMIDDCFKYIIQIRHTTLWFLSSLLIINFLLYGIFFFIKNTKNRIFTVIFEGILGCIYFRYIHINLPWNIDIAFVALPFFAAGFFAKKNAYFKTIVENKHNLFLMIFMLTNIITGLLNYYFSGSIVDLFSSRIGIEPIFYISAFSGILFIIIISNRFTHKWLLYLGRNSLLYFAWHQTIIYSVIYSLLRNSTLNPIILKVIVLVLSLLLLTIINEIICRSKLRFILGR